MNVRIAGHNGVDCGSCCPEAIEDKNMLMLEPNTVIQERYLVVDLIGQGGMGAVYEAMDQRLGNRVALKQRLVPAHS